MFFPRKTKQFNCTVFHVSALIQNNYGEEKTGSWSLATVHYKTNLLNRFSGAKIHGILVLVVFPAFNRLYSTECSSLPELILFKIFRQSYLTTAFKIKGDWALSSIEDLIKNFWPRMTSNTRSNTLLNGAGSQTGTFADRHVWQLINFWLTILEVKHDKWFVSFWFAAGIPWGVRVDFVVQRHDGSVVVLFLNSSHQRTVTGAVVCVEAFWRV